MNENAYTRKILAAFRRRVHPRSGRLAVLCYRHPLGPASRHRKIIRVSRGMLLIRWDHPVWRLLGSITKTLSWILSLPVRLYAVWPELIRGILGMVGGSAVIITMVIVSMDYLRWLVGKEGTPKPYLHKLSQLLDHHLSWQLLVLIASVAILTMFFRAINRFMENIEEILGVKRSPIQGVQTMGPRSVTEMAVRGKQTPEESIRNGIAGFGGAQ